MKKRLISLALCLLALFAMSACDDAAGKPTTKPETKEEMQAYKEAWGDVLRALDALDAEVRAAIGEDVYGGTVLDHYSGDPQHYFYLTDLDAAPKIKNKRFHLVEVKYSEKQLLEFQKQLSAHYQGKLEFFTSGISVQDNAVTLTVPTGTDLADLETVVPLDAVKVSFADENTVEEIKAEAKVARGELKIIADELKQRFGDDVSCGGYYRNIETDPQYYYTLTDIGMAPEIAHERVHFVEVKYARETLNAYRDTVWNYYEDRGVQGMGVSAEKNKVTAEFAHGTDLGELYTMVPADAIEYVFVADNFWWAVSHDDAVPTT